MEKRYMDDGNGWGTEEMINKMISDVTEIDSQLYFSRTVSQILDSSSYEPSSWLAVER